MRHDAKEAADPEARPRGSGIERDPADPPRVGNAACPAARAFLERMWPREDGAPPPPITADADPRCRWDGIASEQVPDRCRACAARSQA
ncbi:MAG: hypothetical protein DI556_22015 [Rhodovulum sulfidophilum]|uniref:Uncharacterized protein n=1 Tax=Rhodovulum sulfidophilum TaxID=35806 RepID=A0A2W5MWY5_RHOSU|nr:MAG: hypothetical protein DI556_22015 [Rhodovulum sulfidophilum]